MQRYYHINIYGEVYSKEKKGNINIIRKMCDKNTILYGVVCNVCKKTLPPHTIKNHLNIKFMDVFHTCEKKK